MRHLSELAVRLGDGDLATRLLPIVAGYAGQMLVSYTGVTIEAAAERARAQLLHALGRSDDALAMSARAEALEDAFGAAALAAWSRHWRVRLLLARGGPDDTSTAATLLDRSRLTARALGMYQLATECDRLGPLT